MLKKIRLWVLVAIISLLLPGSMALAGGMGSGKSGGGSMGGASIKGKSVPSPKRVVVRSKREKTPKKKKRSSVAPGRPTNAVIAFARQNARPGQPIYFLGG